MLGRGVMFVAGGWLLMSAFAWPQSELSCANTCIAGGLSIVYALLSIFYGPARYLNTAHACLVCMVSLSLDGCESVACANNVMVAAALFGASLWPEPRSEPRPGFFQGSRAAGAGLIAQGVEPPRPVRS